MASSPPVPTFGAPKKGLRYTRRPCAFGVAADKAGRILCVKVTSAGQSWLDLPGGRIEKGETETEAMTREFEEESGLTCKAGALLVRTRQYLVTAKGKARLNISGYFAASAGKKSKRIHDSDHDPVWLSPADAIAGLRDEAAALAVAIWLRRARSDC